MADPKLDKQKAPNPDDPVSKQIERLQQASSAPGAPEVGNINISEEGKIEAAKSETPPPALPSDDAIAELNAQVKDEPLAEDKETKKSDKVVASSGSIFDRIKNFFYELRNNRKKRLATIIITTAVVTTAVSAPFSRYFILNSFGVRGSSSLTVLDDSTKLPLKNVAVKLGNQKAITASDGIVKLSHLKLGGQSLTVQKRGFASINRKVTLGWGSNPLGNISLSPIGTQYSFLVTDFLSGKPVANAEASSGEASALSNKEGKILLTIDKEEAAKDLDVTIKADERRDEIVHITSTTKDEQAVKMVPSHKLAFITKRSGKYDVYKVDADGKNQTLALAGTGRERGDLVLSLQPSANIAALVSTRDNVRNPDGFLLSTLTVIDLTDNQTTSVVQAERVQLVGWTGDKLIYVQIVAGASASDPQRYRLVAYDSKQNDRKELATSNFLNDVVIAHGTIYYAPSSGTKTQAFYKINADGSNKQSVLPTDVFNIFRTGYDQLTLAVGNGWYDYKLTEKPTKLSGQPTSQQNRAYQDSPNGESSAWVDSRDGKGVLLVYNLKDKTDKVIRSQSGLKLPMYWLGNNTLVYRVKTDQETADYVMSIDGGEPRKVSNVTDAGGLDQWYYY